MALFSILFAASAGGFYGLGYRDSSLIYANIVNLSARISFAVAFISNYYTERRTRDALRWSKVFVRPIVGACLATTALAVRLASWRASGSINGNGKMAGLFSPYILVQIGLSITMGVGCLGLWWIKSGRYLQWPRSK
jgi:oligosaccharide translocation protein RFT1